MVEYIFDTNYSIDNIFQSLADPTRRDILARLCRGELTVSALALDYDISLAAVAKHLKILEKAKLIAKRKQGRQQIAAINLETVGFATEQLEEFKKLWNERFDTLDDLLNRAEVPTSNND